MDIQSPLTQQARPEVFKPKVVTLYEELFHDEHFDHSEGFWHSLFLLRPDADALKSILICFSADDLLHRHLPTQDFFFRAIDHIRRGQNPTDENALDTLTVFLENVLSKKYPNPSSDTITVLAGLEDADSALASFVDTLGFTIKDGRTLDIRRKAVRAVIAAVAGAYQTGLVSYFVNHDLYPALIKLVQEADQTFRIFAPCALLGLLANYNKFESRNPYQLRIGDYANDSALRRVGEGISHTLKDAQEAYTAVQDDIPEGWDFNSTLSWVGLGRLTKSTARAQNTTLTEDDIKLALATQPISESAILLATYDFINANKVFCQTFVSPPLEPSKEPAPIDDFCSFSSYLVQNAYRSIRASLYSQTVLLIMRILLEDVAVARSLCNGELLTTVRLCRQRQPLLPTPRTDRTRVAILLDVLVGGINHNLRKRLDIDLYVLFLDPILRILSYLNRTRARIPYHWSELWRALLDFLRFMTTYSNELSGLYGVDILSDRLVGVLALALSTGERFLPDEKSYDDLFYKVLESGDLFKQFDSAYDVSKRAASSSMEVLTGVSAHYQSLLAEKGKATKHLGTREINKLIKQGYDTLSIHSKEGVDQWAAYREADHRNLIKKVTRTAVEDMRILLAERTG